MNKNKFVTNDYSNVDICNNKQSNNEFNSESFISDMLEINNKKLEDLSKDNSNLIIFGNERVKKEKDDATSSVIFSINDTQKTISTYGVVGFIGYKNSMLTIKSSFEDNKEDYFFHYMLSKVFAVNMVDMPHDTSHDKNFSFYIYLFKYFFLKAIKQGIFKKYEYKKYNDSKPKGTIDFDRYIKYDIPFNGKIAYSTKEYSENNSMIHLIRHTIEYISLEKNHSFLFQDKELREFVNTIKIITPNYSKNHREKIIQKNLKPLYHPYYFQYEDLRKLCISILKQEELKYSSNNNEIYGILFNSYWLWEEYLNTILKNHSFIHPENIQSSGGIYLLLNNKWKAYPDFYSEKQKCVIDAKYKKSYSDLGKIENRSDRFQILSYMYVLESNIGLLLVPSSDESLYESDKVIDSSEVNFFSNSDSVNKENSQKHKNVVGLYRFYIPKNCSSMNEFREKIFFSENILVKNISSEFKYL